MRPSFKVPAPVPDSALIDLLIVTVAQFTSTFSFALTLIFSRDAISIALLLLLFESCVIVRVFPEFDITTFPGVNTSIVPSLYDKLYSVTLNCLKNRFTSVSVTVNDDEDTFAVYDFLRESLELSKFMLLIL